MTRHTPNISPLPFDTASGAVSLDFAATRFSRGWRMLFKAVRNRVEARAIADMSDRELADIGLTRQDVKASFASAFHSDPTVELALRARTNSRQLRV